MEVKKDPGSAGIGSIEELFSFPTQSITETPIEELTGNNEKPIIEENKEIPPQEEESSLTDTNNLGDKDEPAGENIGDSEKQPKPTGDSVNQYRQSLKNILGKSVETILIDQDGEEVEMSLDELDIDQETFENIIKQNLLLVKEEAGQNKVSLDGISEFTKSLIEVEKNGGDTLKLLEIKENYLNPLSQIDITTKQGQIDAIYLIQQAQGQNPEDIQMLIKGYEASGVLEEKAAKAETDLRSAIDGAVAKEKEQAQKLSTQREEEMKVYKKQVKEQLGSRFQLNDNIKSKIVDFATKKGSDNRYEIDKEYNLARRDPERAAELSLFLMDRNEFIKQVTNKEVTETKLNTARKIKIVKTTNDYIQNNMSEEGKSRIGKLTDLM